MIGLWRSLFRDNPMNIETLRAVRRFTVTAGRTEAIQRRARHIFVAVLGVIYLWLLITILAYREDFSEGLFWIEFVLLTVLIPGSLYAAISGERERMTWDSLILTPLSPARILAGKLIWRLGLAGILLLAFTPLLLLTHFVSKYPAAYSLPNLVWIQTCLAAWSVFVATFTLWVSARTKRSIASLAFVVVSLMAFLLLIPALTVIFRAEIPGRWAPNMGRPEWEMGHPEWQADIPLTVYLSTLLMHLNPGAVISGLAVGTIRSTDTDFWRDFMTPAFGWRDGLSGQGIYTILPLVYLSLAVLCLVGTFRALARLGLPLRDTSGFLTGFGGGRDR